MSEDVYNNVEVKAILVNYNDKLYRCKKCKLNQGNGYGLLLIADGDELYINAPLSNSNNYTVVIDTVNYPYVDVALQDASIINQRVAKALKGTEEYPVYELTRNFIEY